MADYTILAGTVPQQVQPLPPFSPLVMDFLQALSKELQTRSLAHTDMTWAALGFWLRRAHVKQMAQEVSHLGGRLGRGLVFHIAPTNMPAMFAYSLAISMLAGNGNIVRISPRQAASVQPICDCIETVWSRNEFSSLRDMNALITYDHDKNTTDELTAQCDGRIIWGGNESIAQIRQSILPPQAVELVFADRYSCAVIDSATVLSYSEEELNHQAHLFYNDTYETDQNACSSPHMIFWLGSHEDLTEKAKKRWWHAVAKESTAYTLQPIKASTKYTDAWEFTMTCPQIDTIEHVKNSVYIYTLSSLPKDITTLSGAFGQFFQYSISALDEIMPYMDKKIQTISTLGIHPGIIRQLLLAHRVMGVDRVVPVGQAMDMSIFWDGMNMIESLSRIIG